MATSPDPTTLSMEEITQLCTYLSRPYALDALQLLVNYRDLSASEMASRLRLHIRTTQEYLDGLTELGILSKAEVYEKKRPYYRYQLAVEEIGFNFDLNLLKQEKTLKRGIQGKRLKAALSPDYLFKVLTV